MKHYKNVFIYLFTVFFILILNEHIGQFSCLLLSNTRTEHHLTLSQRPEKWNLHLFSCVHVQY